MVPDIIRLAKVDIIVTAIEMVVSLIMVHFMAMVLEEILPYLLLAVLV